MAGSVFGGRGAAPFLTKATTACAILFMLTSLSLNFVRPGRQSSSVLERTLQEGSEPAVTNEMPIQLETLTDETAPVDAETDTEENSDSE